MKRIIILLSFAFYLLPAFGQSPNGMTYQAVIRNSSDQLVSNTTIGIQISILQGSVSGTVVYSEIQTPMTNANGLISIEVGNGNGFDTINWANGPYFIKAEVDLAGGTNYAITGTSQLLSVPYALHAKTAESITGGINETDPVYSSSPASGITTPDIQNWNTAYNWGNHANAGYLTQESQILNISNDTIYLTGGSFVKLPAGFNGQYSSLTGAPTNVSAFTNDAGYLTSEIDGSVTNELQTLSISNDTVYLTNGGFIKLPVGFDGQYSSLTGTPTNVSAFTNDAGYLTHESQILNIFNDTIYLTGGSFVKLPAGFDGQYSSLTGVPTNVSAFTNDAGYINSEVDPKIGTMTDGYTPKWNGTNLVTGAVYQDASGNVGIGTTSPTGMLHVENTGTTLFKVGDDVTLAGMTNKGTGAAGSVNITGGSDITGTGTSGGSVTIMAGAWGATDRAKIVLNAVGTGGTGGGLTISGGFSTAGSINIGRRTVNGGPAGAVVIAGGDGGSNGNGGTVTLAGGTGTGDVSYRGGDVVIKGGDGQSPSPAGNILFKIGNVEKARFSNAGKFGIGTTTPTADLEVNGDVKVSGSIYAPGTVVQTVVQTSDVTSSLNTTTLTEADPSYRISITPKYANSIILIEYSFSINTAFDHNTIFRMQLIRDIGGTEVPVGIGPVNGLRNQSTFTGRTQGFDTNDNQTIYMVAKDQGLSVGTTYTYGFKYQREGGGGGTCYFNYSMGDSDIYGFSGIMTMKITEIAQ